MKKAVFIDRDGVIVEDPGFVHRLEDFKLIKNAVEGFKLLKNYMLFIVTNQSGIGLGHYKIEDFLKFNNHLIKELEKLGIKIEKTYCCPHRPEDNCECRKPKTKFLDDAAKEFNVDLKSSFVIGDKETDIKFGKTRHCKTILIANEMKDKTAADYVAKDLLEAAEWIIENEE